MQLSHKNRSLIALFVSAPVTSIGAIMALLIAPGVIGQSVLVICQIWLFFLPIIWLLKIEHKPLKISQSNQLDWITGIVIGLFMFVTILAVYWFLLRHWIDADLVRGRLKIIGNINRQAFILGSIYFSFVNALIEEYVLRWFVYSRFEELVSSRLAVLLTAFFFTLHHAIGLAVFTNWRVALIGSLVVFIAGWIWSEYYRRCRSLWGNYFSHAIADVALHIVAWQVFFR